MKTAQEILSENIRGLHNDTGLVRKLVQIMNEYAIEVAREALKNASENAKIRLAGHKDELAYGIESASCNTEEFIISITQLSILDKLNIPKL